MKRSGLVIIAIVLGAFFMANAQEQAQASKDEAMDTVKLRELVVTASKPLTRIEGDGMVSTIAGTVLSKLGTAKDVLGFIPGVISNGGSIEVFGKGAPVVYLNGRKIRNLTELEHLSSANVKDVTVINNPGAKYGSGVNAVIKITTIKELGDGFSLSARTTVGVRDYIYGKEQADVNYRSGGLDVTGMLEYNKAKRKGYNDFTQDIWLTNHEKTTLSMGSKSRSQGYGAKLGFNYTISPDHSFGIYYKMAGRPTKSNAVSESLLEIDEQIEDSGVQTQKNRADYYEHLIDGYYSGNIGKWTADLTLDAMWKRSSNSQSTVEDSQAIGTRDITNRYKSIGRMLAGELRLSRPVLKGSVNVGMEYTNSKREESFLNKENVLPDVENTIKEDNVAFYGELAQRIGSIDFTLGLRYEHTDNNYYEFGKRVAEQSRRYEELLPSANIVIPIKKAVIQFGYSRKYNRPLYSQLSSAVTYVTQYLYETGNPLLKTPFSDIVTMNMRYKWLTLMASYNHDSNQIIQSCEAYDKDPSIMLLKKVNSTKDFNKIQVMAMAMPGFIGKCYYPVLGLGVESQFYETSYHGEMMKMNHPIMIVRFNNIFSLPGNCLLRADLEYTGSGDIYNFKVEDTWQINLSATKTFNTHWDMKLSIMDVFNTAKGRPVTYFTGVSKLRIAKAMTSRNIELSVGYKFNVPKKTRYKGRGAGNAEKNRL